MEPGTAERPSATRDHQNSSDEVIINREIFDKLLKYDKNKVLARKAAAMFTNFGSALNWCDEAEEADADTEATGGAAAADGERRDDNEMSAIAETPAVSERRSSLTQRTTLDDRFQAIVKIQMDDTEDSLAQILHIWRRYRERVASISSTDYLSLDHIGLFLRRLRENVYCEPIKRTIPQCLTTDMPNFVLCPERSVFQLVLSLYMSQSDAPLPLPSEVLLCTSSTTTEEVELIWARAFTESPSGDRKLYSILWIDNLRTETTHEFEKRLQAMAAQQRTLQHPLLIVSITDAQENAYLMSSLDFNIIDFHSLRPYMSDAVKIQKWLKQKLHCTDPTAVSASSVDPELCCVRLVTSEQSGMGKSVFVQRCVEQLRANLSRHTSFQNAHLANDTLAVTISLHQKLVETEYLMEQLFLWRATAPIDEQQRPPAVIHLDVSREVREGLDRVLFSLLILGALRRRDGFVWLRHPRDLYIIENTPLLQRIITSRM